MVGANTFPFVHKLDSPTLGLPSFAPFYKQALSLSASLYTLASVGEIRRVEQVRASLGIC